MTNDAPDPAAQPTAAVIGASFAGLLAATAAAQAGYQVTILERDRLPTDPTPRTGVPQSEQAHVLLRRGLLALESLLPGIEAELLEQGGVPFYTSQMPWLSEYGWVPQNDWAYEIITISRPLLEQITRTRVLAEPGVRLRDDVRVSGLSQTAEGWRIRDHNGVLANVDLVIDASGRASRLPHWLSDIGITTPEPTVIDAKVGYATRRYRGSLPITTGVSVAATTETLAGALLLPIERDQWLVCAAGYGDRRPTRDVDEFNAFLAGLRDPVIAEAAQQLEPVSEVAVHRQTANRRHAYGSQRNWPPGLLVVGDALCSFNPVFGQGISVAVSESELLRAKLRRPLKGQRATRRLQRRLAAVVDLPWSVATSEDLRMPTSEGRRSPGQELTARWVTRMVRLAVGGNEVCGRAFSQVYHLMGSPLQLVNPRVVAAMLRSLFSPLPPPAERPAVLTALAATGSKPA